ncbi:hypothetical protein SOVF_120060 [Spinacia oleracea]|nr:hypothetical protein SOVF_120060 [Spinacia oleracea]
MLRDVDPLDFGMASFSGRTWSICEGLCTACKLCGTGPTNASFASSRATGNFQFDWYHSLSSLRRTDFKDIILCMLVFQYAKRLYSRAHSILERYALLLCLGLIWAFAAILIAGGVYNRVKEKTKMSRRNHHEQSLRGLRVVLKELMND